MRKILGGVRRADERFSMISPGDKIAVGLSGGKDSMLLLYALTPVSYTHLVRIPIGISLGASNMRAPTSTQIRKIAPRRTDSGITFL